MMTKMRQFDRSWVLFLRVLASVLVLCLGLFTVSQAHEVEPSKTEPADGAILEQSPEKVTAWFTEELVAEKSTFQVFDAQGKQVDQGNGGVDLNDPSHMVLTVGLPKLAEGVYTVKWDVGLTDGDSAQGSFQFGVGNVSIPASAPAGAVEPEAGSPPAETSQSSLGLIIGGLAVLVVVILVAVFLFRKRGQPPAGA